MNPEFNSSESTEKAGHGAGEMTGDQEHSPLFRGPSIDSQHPASGSQPSITPVLADPTPSSSLQGHQVHIWYKYIYVG